MQTKHVLTKSTLTHLFRLGPVLSPNDCVIGLARLLAAPQLQLTEELSLLRSSRGQREASRAVTFSFLFFFFSQSTKRGGVDRGMKDRNRQIVGGGRIWLFLFFLAQW